MVRIKDPNAPKRPRTAFIAFTKISPVSKLSVPVWERNRMLAKAWQELPENEKEKLREVERIEMREYRLKLKEYMQTDSYKTWCRNHENSPENTRKSRKRIKNSQNKENFTDDNLMEADNISIFTPEFIRFNTDRESNYRKIYQLNKNKQLLLSNKENELKLKNNSLESIKRENETMQSQIGIEEQLIEDLSNTIRKSLREYFAKEDDNQDVLSLVKKINLDESLRQTIENKIKTNQIIFEKYILTNE